MTGADGAFSPDWLALREEADHRSRAGALTARLEAEWRARGWTQVLDLGSGTGSNLRYLASRLAGAQHWTLVDRDADLLARAEAVDPAQRIDRVCGDLEEAGLPAVAGTDLVTCSALLDLVSEAWLGRLARACRAAACGAYLALTYDGAMHWSAAEHDADDALIRGAVNAHQRRERPPAPALGPAAAAAADALFRAAGYRTWRLPSPWRLGPDDRPLALALVDDWERAALDLALRPERARRIRAWAARRRRTAARGRFRLTVGHQDLLALPPCACRLPRFRGG